MSAAIKRLPAEWSIEPERALAQDLIERLDGRGSRNQINDARKALYCMVLDWCLDNRVDYLPGERLPLKLHGIAAGRGRYSPVGTAPRGPALPWTFDETVLNIFFAAGFLFKDGLPHYHWETDLRARVRSFDFEDAIDFADHLGGEKAAQSMADWLGIRVVVDAHEAAQPDPEPRLAHAATPDLALALELQSLEDLQGIGAMGSW